MTAAAYTLFIIWLYIGFVVEYTNLDLKECGLLAREAWSKWFKDSVSLILAAFFLKIHHKSVLQPLLLKEFI